MYMLLFLYLPQYLLLIVGIPMGTNCDPLINDVIIYTAMIVNLCLRSTTDPSKHSQISLFKISEDTSGHWLWYFYLRLFHMFISQSVKLISNWLGIMTQVRCVQSKIIDS